MNPTYVLLDSVADGNQWWKRLISVNVRESPRGYELTWLGVDSVSLKATSVWARDHTCWLKGLIGRVLHFIQGLWTVTDCKAAKSSLGVAMCVSTQMCVWFRTRGSTNSLSSPVGVAEWLNGPKRTNKDPYAHAVCMPILSLSRPSQILLLGFTCWQRSNPLMHWSGLLDTISLTHTHTHTHTHTYNDHIYHAKQSKSFHWWKSQTKRFFSLLNNDHL